MPTKRDRDRIKIFNKYSTNLELQIPHLKGTYACPICLSHGFDLDSVLGPEPLLTEEHSIPRKMGKKLTVLTCKKCNSTAGDSIDHQLYKRLRFENAWKPMASETIPGFIEFDGEVVAVDFRRSDVDGQPNLETVIKPKGSRKGSADRLQKKMQQKMQENGDVIQFNLKFDSKAVPDLPLSHVALLKTAYLLMFRHFGYSYIFSHHLDPVRQQILHPTESHVPMDAIVFQVDINQLPSSIAVVTAPEELDAYLVPIPLSKFGVGKMIALPSHSGTFTDWKTRHDETNRAAPVGLSYKRFRDMDILDPKEQLVWRGDSTWI